MLGSVEGKPCHASDVFDTLEDGTYDESTLDLHHCRKLDLRCGASAIDCTTQWTSFSYVCGALLRINPSPTALLQHMSTTLLLATLPCQSEL